MTRALGNRWVLAVLSLIALARVATPVVVSVVQPFEMLDFLVYRQAGTDVLDGVGVYAGHSGRLPFTYPVFAALAFVPLAWIGPTLGQWVFTAVTYAAVGCSVIITVTVVGRRSKVQPRVVVGWVLLSACLAPVVRSVLLGQVGPLLMLAVLADLFVVPPRWRGVLTGLAAGFKITPALFVALPILRRDWGWALRMAATVVATIGVSALVRFSDTRTYWTSLLWDARRVGGLAYADNASLTGVVARALGQESPSSAVMLPIQAAVLGWALYAARRQLRANDELAALLAVAVGGLLVSPVSWSHHWVWVVPTVIWLGYAGRPRLAFAAVAVAAVEPLSWVSLLGAATIPGRIAAAALPALGLVLLATWAFGAVVARSTRSALLTPADRTHPSLPRD